MLGDGGDGGGGVLLLTENVTLCIKWQEGGAAPEMRKSRSERERGCLKSNGAQARASSPNGGGVKSGGAADCLNRSQQVSSSQTVSLVAFKREARLKPAVLLNDRGQAARSVTKPSSHS